MSKRNAKKFGLTGNASDSAFPETRGTVLQAAANGDWEPFVERYLAPCWRELLIECRQRGLGASAAEELLQDFIVRALDERRFARKALELLRKQGEDPDFQGNLVRRYLKYGELAETPARFRTFLKCVMLNLVREEIRRRQRRSRLLSMDEIASVEPWIEASIGRTLDVTTISTHLSIAAEKLRDESARAATKATRRLFCLLCRSAVDGLSEADLAREFGLSRSTIAGLLVKSRARFLVLLQKSSGIDETRELKKLVAHDPQALSRALSVARCGSDT